MSLFSAETAKAWQYGFFNAISWGQVRPQPVCPPRSEENMSNQTR